MPNAVKEQQGNRVAGTEMRGGLLNDEDKR